MRLAEPTVWTTGYLLGEPNLSDHRFDTRRQLRSGYHRAHTASQARLIFVAAAEAVCQKLLGSSYGDNAVFPVNRPLKRSRAWSTD